MRRAERNFNKPKNKKQTTKQQNKRNILGKGKNFTNISLKKKKRVTKRMELTLNTGNVKFYLEECV